MIPYANEYTSTASGAVLKYVHCEQCQIDYFYEMKRTAQGSGTSLLFLDNQGASSRASAEASGELRRKLEQGIDTVPCPGCGWYQKAMFPKLRSRYRKWMLNLGLCLTLGVIPIAVIGGAINAGKYGPPKIPWPIFGGVLGFVALLGIVLVIVKFVSASRYDPNSEDVKTRRRLGRERGILRETLERLLAEQKEDAPAPKREPTPQEDSPNELRLE